jgi:DMSO/TMAO reductase YedYZ molybdopterin-dependent catalytic subunit
MSEVFSRRKFMAGLSALSGIALTGCNRDVYVPPHFGGLLDASDALTMSVQRMLLTEQSMAREYSVADISDDFPVVGTRMPGNINYVMSLSNNFRDWRLRVGGLVDRPLSLSLADLKKLPAITSITSHSCEEGWTAIGQWTGTALSQVLELAGLQRKARYITFQCADGWYDYLDLFDALHAQTILAYGMNGNNLPIPHGAPVRLRVARHLGYKSLKFIQSIRVVDTPKPVYDDSSPRLFHFSWYAGI